MASFLSHHIAVGTKSGYKYAYAKFSSFCSQNGYCPKSCSPEIIVQYLKQLFDDGCSYSTVNTARSAISKYHDGFNGNTAGSHKLISIALKAVFRMQPPLPKYRHTFDVSLVFNYLKSMPQNEQLSLKMLSMKTLFLLIVSSLSRVSSVARLGPDLLVYKVRINKYFIPYLFFLFKDHVIINLTTLEKQSRPGNIRGYLRIQSFTDDDCLCPMAALVEYDKRVSVY